MVGIQELTGLLILATKMMLRSEVLNIKLTDERKDKDYYPSKKQNKPD
jgi:hypothetical protein